MKFELNIFVIGLILFLQSCSVGNVSPQGEALETIVYDVDAVGKEVDITSLIDTSYYEMIRLETDDRCLIGEVSRIWLQQDKLFVYDRLSKGVFVFNKDGSYHSRVLAVGQGPSEYPPVVNDVFVSDGFIYLLTPVVGKIYVYDWDGTFVKTIDLNGSWGEAMFSFDGERFCLLNAWGRSEIGAYHAYILESKTSQVQPLGAFNPEYLEDNRGWGLDDYYSLAGDRALFLIPTCDTIYELDRHYDYHPRYAIDIVKKRLPRNLAEGDAHIALQRSIADVYIIGVNKVLDAPKVLLLLMSDLKVIAYDKQEKKLFGAGENLKITPFAFRFNFPQSWGDTDVLLYPMTADDIQLRKTWVDELVFENKSFERDYKNMLNAVESEQENPVVFLFKWKKS